MARRALGDFSKLSFRSIELATALQGMAVDHIRETFKTEETGPNLNDLSLGDFIKALIEADESGTRDQFEANLAAQLAPLLDQVFAPQPQQAAPGGSP